MPQRNWLAMNRIPHSTVERMKNHIAEFRVNHLCSYAALTLSCLAGCQTTREMTDSATPAIQSPANVLSRAGDRIGESFETAFEPFSRRTKACPTDQAADQAMASKIPTYPKSLARNPSQAILPTQIAQQNGANSSVRGNGSPTPSANAVANNNRASTVEFLAPPPTAPPKPKTVQPVVENTPSSHSEQLPTNNNSMKSMRPESAPAPIAPPEPLPAQSVSQSRAVTPTSAVTVAPDNTVTNATATSSKTTTPLTTNAVATNTTWCRVRVRNVSNQAATQVSLGVTSPANTQLIAADSGVTSPQANGRMDFAPIPQVGPNEEVIVTVGVAAADKESNRLRVQVRDAQGGTNQEVQSRWKVILEAAEQP